MTRFAYAGLILFLALAGCGQDTGDGGGGTATAGAPEGWVGHEWFPGAIPVIDFHENDQCKMRGQMIKGPDGKAVNHGEFVHYYADGRVNRQGRYEHGKKVGEWLQWYPNMDQPVRQVWKDGEVVNK